MHGRGEWGKGSKRWEERIYHGLGGEDLTGGNACNGATACRERQRATPSFDSLTAPCTVSCTGTPTPCHPLALPRHAVHTPFLPIAHITRSGPKITRQHLAPQPPKQPRGPQHLYRFVMPHSRPTVTALRHSLPPRDQPHHVIHTPLHNPATYPQRPQDDSAAPAHPAPPTPPPASGSPTPPSFQHATLAPHHQGAPPGRHRPAPHHSSQFTPHYVMRAATIT